MVHMLRSAGLNVGHETLRDDDGRGNVVEHPDGVVSGWMALGLHGPKLEGLTADVTVQLVRDPLEVAQTLPHYVRMTRPGPWSEHDDPICQAVRFWVCCHEAAMEKAPRSFPLRWPMSSRDMAAYLTELMLLCDWYPPGMNVMQMPSEMPRLNRKQIRWRPDTGESYELRTLHDKPIDYDRDAAVCRMIDRDPLWWERAMNIMHPRRFEIDERDQQDAIAAH